MIGELMLAVYSPERISELLRYPIVSGCLLRSLGEFAQHIVWSLLTNRGQLGKREVEKLAAAQRLPQAAFREGEAERSGKQLRERLDATEATLFGQAIKQLRRLKLVHFDRSEGLQINPVFQEQVSLYLENLTATPGKPLPDSAWYDSEFFNLLHLLREYNSLNLEVLHACRLNLLNSEALTKENFDFIRASPSEKVMMVLRGYMLVKHVSHPLILLSLLEVSLLKRRHAYPILPQMQDLIRDLESLKLTRRLPNNHFLISDLLHHFGFEKKQALATPAHKAGPMEALPRLPQAGTTESLPRLPQAEDLHCEMIVEANFKVYTEVRPSTPANFELTKTILRSLLKIEHEGYSLNDELIVGEITRDKLQELFERGITAQEYFSFFKLYVKHRRPPQDLGKWSKLRFLGIEAGDEDGAIPNNVLQEVRLWEALKSSYDAQSRFSGDEDLSSH